MKRIVCIGHPFADQDAAGGAVHARLRREALPPGVELVDGGLRGLDLLALVQASERVAFVDSVSGWGPNGEVLSLDAEQLQEAEPARYGHAGGFAYLLRALPHLVKPLPPLRLIGLEGEPSATAVEAAAGLALAFVQADGGAR